MPEILLRSGRLVDLMNPQPEDIDAYQLSIDLARVNRWGGQTLPPYTVAEHSVRVSQALYDHQLKNADNDYEFLLAAVELSLAALLHDAHEGPIGIDATSPVKELIGEALRPINEAWDKAIAAHFEIDVAMFHDDRVKFYDDVLLATEHRDVMPPDDSGWIQRKPEPLEEKIEPMRDPATNFRIWLNRLLAQRSGLRGEIEKSIAPH